MRVNNPKLLRQDTEQCVTHPTSLIIVLIYLLSLVKVPASFFPCQFIGFISECAQKSHTELLPHHKASSHHSQLVPGDGN